MSAMTETEAAWESAIYNAERARKAEEEIARLRAELASERNKPKQEAAPQGNEGPDCRTCTEFDEGTLSCMWLDFKCVDGRRYSPADPIRLYATGGDSDSTG